MFLDLLLRRNPQLVADAVDLHQQGRIPANSYVIDLDAIRENARAIAAEADRHSLKAFVMTKQFGRNGPVMDAASASGLDAFVAMDMDCARAIARAGHHVAHIGHLIQIPRRQVGRAALMEPDYWTVFNQTKATMVAEAARALGRTQPVLARMSGDGDVTPPALAGGFPAERIDEAAEALDSLPGVAFAGVTMYPGVRFNSVSRHVEPTANLGVVERAVARLHQAGVQPVEVNTPGEASAAVLGMLASAGVTQVEPGHGLSGTTPLHAYQDLPERPAMLYLTEVSHIHGSKAYCFGGGLYVCVGQHHAIGGQPLRAAVGRTGGQALRQRVPAQIPPPPAIDFYGTLDLPSDLGLQPGASVVWGFRAQAFVTRAHIAPVSGVGSAAPEVVGIWSSDGRRDDDL